MEKLFERQTFRGPQEDIERDRDRDRNDRYHEWSVSIKETEFVVTNSPTMKTADSDDITGEFFLTFNNANPTQMFPKS